MKRSFVLLPALVLLATVTAAAQTKPTFSIGVRGGLNRASTTIDPVGNSNDSFTSASITKSAIFAWQTGLVGELAFGKLSLQPALLFSQKGEKFHRAISAQSDGLYYFSERNGTNRYNWLELPIHLVYTLHRDHGLQLFAGPYVAVAVGGHQKGTYLSDSPAAGARQVDVDESIAYGSNTYNRRLDVGLNLGLGYRLGPVQVQATYGLGLRNLHTATFSSLPSYNSQADAAYNRVAQLTGTYFFKL